MSPKIVDKEARRRDTLAAAATVFAKFGYQRATIDQIAEAAGVAKGSVYLSFDSKEDLFYAVFEEFARAAIADEPSEQETENQTVLDRVAGIICRTAEMADANEAMIPLTLEFWSVCGVEETRERFGRRYAELLLEFRSLLVGLLQEGRARGEIAPAVPVEAIASCLIAMIDGLLIQQWTAPEVRASAILNRALPVLLRSLQGDGRQ
jgi:AcrR family transcriptional regulator